MSIFAELEGRFSRVLNFGLLNLEFIQWQGRHEDLAQFVDIDELIQFCRNSDPCDEGKDRVISALRKEAVKDPNGPACLFLFWLFRPTLMSLAKTTMNTLEADDLEAELLAGFWETVATQDGITKLCGRLKNGARHRAQKAARKEAIYKRGTALNGIDEDQAVTIDGESPWPLLAQAREQGVLSSVELEIIVRTRFEGQSLTEAADILKMNHQVAGRKRKAAEDRLHAWLSDND